MCSFRIIPRQLHNSISNAHTTQNHITFVPLKRKVELDGPHSAPSVIRGKDISYSFSDQVLSTFPERINQFSRNLWREFRKETRSAKENRYKSENLIFHIRKALENKGRIVIPIGSCVNGLAHRNSDLDLVLMPHKSDNKCHEFSDKFQAFSFRRKYMLKIREVLRSRDICKPSSATCLPFANVPIITFLSKEGIKVDIQFCNSAPIKSSLFVKTCLESNPSVAVVIYWLNRYFENIKLKDSRAGLFSSYHLNMLALHYFQSSTCRMLPELLETCPYLDPNLPWIISANILKTGKKMYIPEPDSNKRSCSFGEIVLRLIDYYSQIDLEQLSIDINGGIFERSSDSSDGFISLIDPYFTSQKQLRCNVKNGCLLIHSTFSVLKSKLERGEFESLEVKMD